MKSLLFLILFPIWIPVTTFAQGENNIWTFATATGGNQIFFNFNGANPALTTTPSYTLPYGSAVCFPNGQLRFFVRLTYNGSGMPPLMNVFNASGQPVPNSDLHTGLLDEGCQPVIVPHPGNSNQYYILYGYSKGLLYTLLDMSLNNGTGGVVAGQKDMVISPYGTVNTQKMTAVKGCNGVWVVLRSRVANQYLSYEVNASGININPVISEIGLFNISDYNLSQGLGYLKASQDGGLIATNGYYGLELYDFEKCSGKLKNPRILDSIGNPLPFAQSSANHTRLQGLCFSPDGTKLYTTQNRASDTLPLGYANGELYQFNLALSSLPAIIASKTLVLTNQQSIMENGPFCNLVVPNPLGEIKSAPNGKLYIDNGSYTCLSPANVPAGFNPGPGFHVIDQPNLAGMTCAPQFNNVVINNFAGNQGGSFYLSGGGGRSYLPQDIVIAPLPPDTIPGQVYFPVACFRDSLILKADSNAACIDWDDGSKNKSRKVYHSGTYYVNFFRDCNYMTDTFHVTMIKLPLIIPVKPSCPDMRMGEIIAMDTMNNMALNYIWKTTGNGIIRQFSGISGDTIRGLNPGNYLLEINSSLGCDTTLALEINALPKPEITTFPIDSTIRYGDSILLHANGGLIYAWSPSGALDTPTKANPVARTLQPTLFSVIGMNEYGCEDTAFVKINIDFTMRDFIPNAFSPNGDGLNDIFRIENITYQKLIAFRIFNRFGQLVFSTLDGEKGWDGLQSGKLCDIGTYYYFIQIDYPDGSRKTFKGNLELLR